MVNTLAKVAYQVLVIYAGTAHLLWPSAYCYDGEALNYLYFSCSGTSGITSQTPDCRYRVVCAPESKHRAHYLLDICVQLE